MSKQKRTVIPQAHVDNLYKKNSKQASKIAELENLLKRISHDLLMRAELDGDGFKVVDLSSSIWINLKDLLKEPK